MQSPPACVAGAGVQRHTQLCHAATAGRRGDGPVSGSGGLGTCTTGCEPGSQCQPRARKYVLQQPVHAAGALAHLRLVEIHFTTQRSVHIWWSRLILSVSTCAAGWADVTCSKACGGRQTFDLYTDFILDSETQQGAAALTTRRLLADANNRTLLLLNGDASYARCLACRSQQA